MPDYIEKEARIFRAGVYPGKANGKDFVCTVDDLKRIADSRKDAPIIHAHDEVKERLDYGIVDGASLNVRGDELWGVLRFHPEAIPFLEKNGMKSLSAGIFADNSGLKEVSMTRRPYIRDAMIFTEDTEEVLFFSMEEEAADVAEFAEGKGYFITVHGHAVYLEGKAVDKAHIAKAAEKHGLSSEAHEALKTAHDAGKVQTDEHLYKTIAHAKRQQDAGKSEGEAFTEALNKHATGEAKTEADAPNPVKHLKTMALSEIRLAPISSVSEKQKSYAESQRVKHVAGALDMHNAHVMSLNSDMGARPSNAHLVREEGVAYRKAFIEKFNEELKNTEPDRWINGRPLSDIAHHAGREAQRTASDDHFERRYGYRPGREARPKPNAILRFSTDDTKPETLFPDTATFDQSEQPAADERKPMNFWKTLGEKLGLTDAEVEQAKKEITPEPAPAPVDHTAQFSRMQGELEQANAQLFAQSMLTSGRILPTQVSTVIAEFSEAAEDDRLAPRTVTFSAGTENKQGSRVDRVKAKYENAKPNRLTEELLPDAHYALFNRESSGMTDEEKQKANEAEYNKMRGMTSLGRSKN